MKILLETDKYKYVKNSNGTYAVYEEAKDVFDNSFYLLARTVTSNDNLYTLFKELENKNEQQ